MTWRWSRTRRFPAQRTSSARRSRLPRTSRSCCEPPRRTNTTGQPRPDPQVSSSVSSPAAPGLFWADGHRSALCSSACVAQCFSISLHPWPSLFSAAMTRPCVTVSLPLPPPLPASPPMEQTVRAKRRCASSQAQPRMFQHAGALGREGPLSPAATRPPAP